MNTEIEYISSEAYNWRTFYRAEASPAVPNEYSYIQLYNPPNSGVECYFDVVYLFGGQPVSSEYGLTYYSTPLAELRGNLRATRMGGSILSKCEVRVGNDPAELGEIDYFFQVAPLGEEPKDHKFPYPIILGPTVGILLWQPCQGFEGKAGMWVREVPIGTQWQI